MSDDLISRQALKQAMYHEAFEVDSDMQKWDGGCWIRYKLFEKIVDIMPSVQPEQKTGRWIYKERNILINTGRVSYGENGAVQEKRWAKVKKPYCSECGWYENSEYEATPYCPNCGAKMENDNEV